MTIPTMREVMKRLRASLGVWRVTWDSGSLGCERRGWEGSSEEVDSLGGVGLRRIDLGGMIVKFEIFRPGVRDLSGLGSLCEDIGQMAILS